MIDSRRLELIVDALRPVCKEHAGSHGVEHDVRIDGDKVMLTAQLGGRRETGMLVSAAELAQGHYAHLLGERAKGLYRRVGGVEKAAPAAAAEGEE